jgi:hypothetical protein
LKVYFSKLLTEMIGEGAHWTLSLFERIRTDMILFSLFFA